LISTIFWDFDGVLAESVNVKTEAFRELYLPHGEEIAEKVKQHHLENGGMSRFEKFPLYHKTFLGEELDEQGVQKMAGLFSELVLTKVIAADEVNGASRFLSEHAGRYANYLISGTPHEEIKVIVGERGWANHFNDVMGSPDSKSKWVERVFERNPTASEECVFIGDARSDFKAAQDHKLHFVLRETEDNKDLFADFNGPRIQDLTELPKVLEQL
jgi:phosphoglycolate phosphatase-like HAD superfamily hydrolase